MSPEPHNLTQKALTVFSVVRKTPLLSHFSTKNEQFTKTDSGQICENAETPVCLLQGPGAGIQLSSTNKHHPNRIMWSGTHDGYAIAFVREPVSRLISAWKDKMACGLYIPAGQEGKGDGGYFEAANVQKRKENIAYLWKLLGKARPPLIT